MSEGGGERVWEVWRGGENGLTVFQRKLIARREVEAQSAVLKLKKRHVERMTRVRTKRMATACWDFIVVTRTLRKTAPLLDFSPLHDSNKENYTQLIHKCLWTGWG